MKKKYDLAVKTGSYQKDGETKNRYENIGSVMQGENGFFMFLKKTFNPAGIESKEGSDSIVVSMFEPNDKPVPQAQQSQTKRIDEPADFDDDIPF